MRAEKEGARVFLKEVVRDALRRRERLVIEFFFTAVQGQDRSLGVNLVSCLMAI